MLSAIPTSAAKTRDSPDLSRPTGPLHATLCSHDSSSQELLAPAKSRQKPCCLSFLIAKRPQGSQGQMDPRTAAENHSIPEQAPLPRTAFLQPIAHCSHGPASWHCGKPPLRRAWQAVLVQGTSLFSCSRNCKAGYPMHTSTPRSGGFSSGLRHSPSHTTSAFPVTNPSQASHLVWARIPETTSAQHKLQCPRPLPTSPPCVQSLPAQYDSEHLNLCK